MTGHSLFSSPSLDLMHHAASLGHFSVLIVGGIAQFEFSRRNADEENSGSGRASIPSLSLLGAFRHIPSPAICN